MIILAGILIFASVALLVYGIVSPRLKATKCSSRATSRRRTRLLLLATPLLAYIVGVIQRRFGENNSYLERIRAKLQHTGVDMPLKAPMKSWRTAGAAGRGRAGVLGPS